VAEEPATPFHIGLAGLLEPGRLVDERGRLRLQELRAAVDARLARVPELRRRVRWTGFGQGRPAVVDDHDFDIARHLTDVDLAGLDEPGFWRWCANRTLEPLDGDHRLWRVTLVTGLAGGQIGVLVVMHHALADGIAGAVLTQRLLDPAPDTTITAQPWRPTPPPSPFALAVDAVVSRLAAVATALRHLPNAPKVDGTGGMDWKLAGLVTVAQAQGPDVARSAAGRAGGEAVWLPTAQFPRFGVRWSAESVDQVTAAFRVGDTPVELRLRLDAPAGSRRWSLTAGATPTTAAASAGTGSAANSRATAASRG
jgi:Wax ester synthase-like Acyl-CoA acyltransferase domain